jgi:hypothetical protein
MPRSIRAANERILLSEYGGLYRVRANAINVVAPVTEIAGAAPGRIMLTLVQSGAGGLAFSLNGAVDSNYGIATTQPGEGISMDVRDDGPVVSQAWFAYAAADTVAYVIEVIEYDAGEGVAP